MLITLTKFPTHLEKSDNKYAPNKMQKLNYQSIYSGTLNRFGRAIVMKNMHEYLAREFEPYKKLLREDQWDYPIKPIIRIYSVINHGDISMRKGKLCWKPAKPGYEATWDVDNLIDIWKKGINDVLQHEGFIVNDSVQYVKGADYEFEEVDHIDDRKLTIRLNEI